MNCKNLLLAVLSAITVPLASRAQTITQLSQHASVSIRGLSVVNNKIAWASGSKGSFATTNDGGNTWAWQQIKGFETLDFRDIEAFSTKEAIVMSSGTPAVILKTTNGGETWQEKYRQTDAIYFLDAMEFTGTRHGFIVGDPINNEFLLLETKDGGDTWKQVTGPATLHDEAAFAASGTCLRMYGKQLVIVSGGSRSRLLVSGDDNHHWNEVVLPLTNGSPSRGAFSVARNNSTFVVVGGDYAKKEITDSVAVLVPISKKSSNTSVPKTGPAGFQSGIEHLSGEFFLATGTSGSNISTDGGKNWRKIDSNSYNVCRKAKSGNLVLLAGDNGKIGVLKF